MNSSTLLPFAELLAKSVLLLGGALLLIASFRRGSAARRHAILLAAFVALLLLPLGKFAAPYWRLSAFAPARQQTMQFTDIVATTNPVTAFEPAATAVQPARFTWPSPTQWLLGSWGTGAVLLLGFRAFGSWRIARLRRRRTVPAGESIAALAQAVAQDLGCGLRHEVRISDAVRVPCTWGLWRAVVLLPVAAEQWSEAHLLAALRHEFAHVTRRDYLTRWLTSAVCALYWPNPLVWFAARKLYAAQEQACDDLVLRAGTPSADYATLLFETARACLGAPLGCREAIAMARPSTLQNRVVAVVDETRDRRPAGRFVKLLGALGAAGAVGVSALAQVDGEKPDTTATAPAQASLAQVEISAKFIEVPKGAYTADQIVGSLEKLKGADLLSAPRVTAHSGQTATIQIGEELPLPPGSEPKTQFVGTSLEVLPTVNGGKIQLRCAVELVARSGLDTPTQHPIFNHRKTTTTLDLANGGKAIIPAIPSDKEGREIFVVLEAKILPPAATKPETPKGADAGSPKTTLDQLLLEKLDEGPRQASEKPADWLRRSFLDIVGRPPTVDEMNAFLREYEAASAARPAAGLGEKPAFPQLGVEWDDLAAQAARAAQRALAQPSGGEPKPIPGTLPPATPAAPEPKPTAPSALPTGSAPEPKLVPLTPTVDSFNALSLTPTPKPPVALETTPGQPQREQKRVASSDYFQGQSTVDPVPTLKPEPVTKPVGGGLLPIDINATEVHVEAGIAVATGGTQLKYGATTITADNLRYDPDQHRAEFHGKVVVIGQDKLEADGSTTKNIGKSSHATFNAATGEVVLTGNPSVQQGVNMCVATDDSTIITLSRDGRMKVDGPHKSVIKDSAADSSVAK